VPVSRGHPEVGIPGIFTSPKVALCTVELGMLVLSYRTSSKIALCENREHVISDKLLISERFPRSSRYNPEWIKSSASGGANSLWLTEWLTESLTLNPGMRVLDLGCGRAASSIFLGREFGVQVWATDLWFSVSENLKRIRDASVEGSVFPIHADAWSLPFASDFFDAIVSIDSYYYYGTNDLYLNYLARFVKPGGQLGIVGAGLVKEIEGPLPEHLRRWWTQDLWGFHSPSWWRQHWERTGIMEIEVADSMTDGWQRWLDWHRAIAPDNELEINALEADRGVYLGYGRLVGRRRGEIVLADHIESVPPPQYTMKPLLRNQK
jgi:SAM-dependent methyltransferase